MHPMGMMPPRMPPTNFGGFLPPPMVRPQPQPETRPSEVFVEKPKIVYAAAPVRVNASSCPANDVSTVVTVSKASERTTLSVSGQVSEAKHVAPGIELNVPVDKIEAEKKQNVVANTTPSEAASTSATAGKKEKKEKKKKFVRMAAGTAWEDQTLAEWDLGESVLKCCESNTVKPRCVTTDCQGKFYCIAAAGHDGCVVCTLSIMCHLFGLQLNGDSETHNLCAL